MFRIFKRNKKLKFQFKEKENTACFTCNHILDDFKPILHVTHDHDGYWQFLCGSENHTTENARIISLKEITDIDNGINNLSEIPFGMGARRKNIHEEWLIFKQTIQH